MKIFVTGQCTLHWGRMEFGNIGNYYIIEPFFRELHKTFPGATITTTFQMSEEFQKRENVTSVPMNSYYSWTEEDLPLAYKEYAIADIYNKTGEIIERTPFIDEVMSSDLVIDFSGDIWGQNADLVGDNRFLIGLLKDRVVQLLGKPNAMLAGSPGPFNRDATLEFAKLVFENFDLVTNREEISKSVLDDFGFNTSKVHNLACPAFEFEPESIENIRPLLKDTPLEEKEKPVIGFVLCGWNMLKGPFNRSDWTDDEFSPFQILLEDLIEKFNVDICLLSHSNGFDVSPEFKLKRGRDYPIVERLYDLLNCGSYSSNVYLFDGIYSPAQTKSIIGQFDMLISGRVHAVVAALSQSVPTMIIDYGHEPKAHKLKGFAKVAEVEDYVADPHSLKNMINIAHQVFEQRIVIREKLAERNVKIKSMIRENFNLLHSIIAIK